MANNDGSCAFCNDGFYAYKGICYKINTDNQLTVDAGGTNNQQAAADQIVTDDSGNKYIVNVDESRMYLTGPWAGLQVWIDQNGNSFVKVANGGRKYLTGPIQGLIAYQDANGNWWAVNGDGKKVFY